MSAQTASVDFRHTLLLPPMPDDLRRAAALRWAWWSIALAIHLALLGIVVNAPETSMPPVLHASLKIPSAIAEDRLAAAALPQTSPHTPRQTARTLSRPPPPGAPARAEIASAPGDVAVVAETPATAAPAPAPSAYAEARFDAAYLHNPKPAYPLISRRQNEEGTALLRVRVGAEGKPLEIALKLSSGSPRLDQAAQEAVARWRFVPARRGDEAVESWVNVPVKFSLESPQ